MYIEYACYNKILAHEVKTEIFRALDAGVDGISLPSVYLSKISSILPDNVVLSSPIDYPNAFGDTTLRVHYAIRAINLGARAIDIVASTFLYYNCKKDFRDDINALCKVADEKGVTPRVIVDHRKLYCSEDYMGILRCLHDCHIDYIMVSTGQYAEDPVDNIILCNIAQKEFGFKAIANGNFYLPEHFTQVSKAKLFGARFNNCTAIERCTNGV